jgi:hypothetical protein
VHRLGAQEVRVARCADPALDPEQIAQLGLALPGGQVRAGRAALGGQPDRVGDRFEDGRFAGAVLADEERDTSR